MRSLTAATLLLGLVAPAGARAHEVLHAVERGPAVAVHVYESDGDPVADAAFEVYAPAQPAKPYQTGRTDPRGYLAFVPDAPGAWRVRVIDPSGHGLDTTVRVEGAGGAFPGAVPQPPAPGIAFVLRPLVGVALLAILFAALFLAQRRKRKA